MKGLEIEYVASKLVIGEMKIEIDDKDVATETPLGKCVNTLCAWSRFEYEHGQ